MYLKTKVNVATSRIRSGSYALGRFSYPFTLDQRRILKYSIEN
jgi:hypothetical protein